MAAPAWFNASVYFQNKLASMGDGWNDLTLKKAFSDAGYSTDANGLYQHFLDYGNAENISPSPYFNVNQYMTAKAAEFYNTSSPTTFQIQAMYDTFAAKGYTAWSHYTQEGWKEGINPAVNFDNDKYMNDKLAQMQIADPSYDMPQLVADFAAHGLSPLEHYFLWGKDEGLTISTPSNTTGELYNLTEGNDTVNGTSGNDYITARPGTLGDGDMINGGGGNDTLYAYLNGSNNASTPLINGVETIIVRGQGVATAETGSNNISASDWTVSLDLGDTTGMTKLVNDNSRSDVAIEDVRTDSNKMTIGFYDADPGDVDFGVFFNSQNIKHYGGGSTGSLSLQLMDVKNAQLNDQPLNEQPFTKFTFYYTADGSSRETIKLQFRAEDEAKYRGPDADYDSLLVAFNNALADLVAEYPQYAGIFDIATGGKFKGTAGTDTVWTDPDGVLIVINAQGGKVDAPSGDTNVGWGVSTGNVPPTGGITWGVDKTTVEECPLYQTNIELDNVGRVQWNDVNPGCLPSNDDFGSQAGDMVVGGMGERDGIQRFDVKVDRGSWLSSLASTNNQLRMVTFVNADINGDGMYNRPEEAYPNGGIYSEADPTKDYGQIYIGDSQEGGKGIVAWQDAPKLLSTTGLTDVKYVDGSAFEGQMNIGAQFTAESYQKYLKDVDGMNTVYSNYAPDGEFLYDLGKNDDTLNMSVHGGIANDQNFKLLINGNGGNDFINFTFSDLTANQNTNIQNGIGTNGNAGHERVIIDGGTGNDVIKSWGNGGVVVDGGAGNDAIYVGQNATDQNAVVLFNINARGAATNAADRAIYWDAVGGAQPLDNNILEGKNDFAVSKAAGAAADTINVVVTFKGISATFKLADIAANTTTAAVTTTITAEQVNEAVAKAIANDKYLQHLIVAKDGAGHSLMIESLVDGALADLGDLTINFETVLANGNAGNSDVDELLEAYYEDFSVTATVGFATEALNVTTFDFITTQGSVNTQEAHTLTIATPAAVEYAIKIGGETYYTDGVISGATIGDLVNALNGATDVNGNLLSAKYAASANGTNLVLTYRAAGAQDDVDVTLYRVDNASLQANETDGTTVGTDSLNLVKGGLGDDTLVLNAAAAARDIVVLDGAFGNDVIVNFSGDSGAGNDVFKVGSLLSTDVAAAAPTVAIIAAATATGAIAKDAITVVNATVAAGDDGVYTLAEVKTAFGNATFAAGTATVKANSLVLLQHAGTNHYTVVQVSNDSTPALVDSEISILGTITMDNDTPFATGDFIV